MADKIPVRYLPTEEAQVSLGEMRPGDTVPVANGGTGATTPEDARTSLGIVDAPGSVTVYAYAMTLPPTATPFEGFVSRDNADPVVTTTLYIHDRDSNGTDQTRFLDAIKTGDWINLYKTVDTDVSEQYDATGPAVLTGDVFAVPVTYYGAAGTLVNGDAISVSWRIAQTVAAWGAIEGTLSDQTDLQAALDGKEPTIDPKNTAFNQSFGTGTTDVATGDHGHATLPTADQKDALDNNNTLDAGNPAASMADITLVGDERYAQSTDDSVADILTVTQAEYDALSPPGMHTLYLICEGAP